MDTAVNVYTENPKMKHDIVSTMAYLIGIPESKFVAENNPLSKETYDRLEKERPARIIRNLCILRTNVIKNYRKIYTNIRDNKSQTMMGMPDLVPQDSLESLNNDGIAIYKHMSEPNEFTRDVNAHISNHINNCSSYFPEWINWDYISSSFIMPSGNTIEGIKAQAQEYYDNFDCYPYHAYISWRSDSPGNILYNDKTFLTLLYQHNNEEFKDYSRVADLSAQAKEDIYAFLDHADKVTFIVDCENSDPYSLCAALMALDEDKKKKLETVILYDDIHTASAWETLGQYIGIPIEYRQVIRLKEDKSLTDVKVSSRICKEYYQNNCRSFILVSSDSDYWGVITELDEANFLVMVEHEKCSGVLKTAFAEKNIPYCYIDDFHAPGDEKIKDDAIEREIKRILDATIDLKIDDMIDHALYRTRIKKDETWREKYIKNVLKNRLEVQFTDEGRLAIGFKEKKKK